ncbi:MAG: hypothetical protein ISS45_12010 [Candidatus Omnitrophica bacterium]|nr:hypothetical protein [Candidatus Omnitrophota bacterium]
MKIKHKKIVIAYTLGLGLIAAIYSILSPPLYKATAQVVLGGVNPRSPLIRDSHSFDEYMDLQHKVLKEKELLDAVIDKLHLRISKRFIVKDPLRVLQRAIKVKHVKATNIVRIEVIMDNPTLASRIATVLAEEYIAHTKSMNFKLTQEAVDWLTETSKLSKKIEEIEKRQARFIEENKPDIVYSDLTAATRARNILIEQKNTETFNLSRVQSQVEYIEENLKDKNIERLLTAFLKDHIIYELKRKRKEKEIELYHLQRERGEGDPQGALLKKEIKELDLATIEYAKSKVKEKKEKMDKIRERLKDLEEQILEQNEQVAELKDLRSDSESLPRELEMYTKLYNKALKQLEKEQFSIIRTRRLILPDPYTVDFPVAPKTSLNVMAGLLGGFILGNIISVVLEKKKK